MRRLHSQLVGLAAFALALAVGIAFTRLASHRERAAQEAEAREVLADAAAALESRLDRVLVALETVTRLTGGGTDIDFSVVASGIPRDRELVGFVRLVGDTLVDADPQRLLAVEAADVPRPGGAGHPVLAGPLRTPAAATPVLLVASPSPPGVVAAVVDVDGLLDRIGFSEIEAAGAIAVELRADRRTVGRTTELDLPAPLVRELEDHAGASWTLAVAPVGGWTSLGDHRERPLLVAVLALIAGFVAFELARRPERLASELARRDSRLRAAHADLGDERRHRAEAEARQVWGELGRIERVAVAILCREARAVPRDELVRLIGETAARARVVVGEAEIETGLALLEEHGVVDGGAVIALRSGTLAELSDVRRDPAEVARDFLDRVGEFEIEERLGGGGMGEVFRGVSREDGRSVAVKLLYPHASGDRELRLRFEREGQIAERVSHPHLVQVLSRGEHDGRLFLAMELVEGPTLSQVLESEGPFDPRRSLQVILGLASGLAVLHQEGLVHRDIKASNVVLADGDRAVLLDFGLAAGAGQAQLTRTDVLLGTPAYMSPERVKGGRPGAAGDVWSLGILWWELLLGRLPWEEVEVLPLFEEVLARDLRVEDEIGDVAGMAVARVLARMLDRDLERRYRSASEVVRHLRILADPGSGVPGMTSRRTRLDSDSVPLVTTPRTVVGGPDLGELDTASRGPGPRPADDDSDTAVSPRFRGEG